MQQERTWSTSVGMTSMFFSRKCVVLYRTSYADMKKGFKS